MAIKIRPYLDKNGQRDGWEVDVTLRFLDGLPPHRKRIKSPRSSRAATLTWIEGELPKLYAQGRPPRRGEKKPTLPTTFAPCPLFKPFSLEWLEKYVVAQGHAPSTYKRRMEGLRLYLWPLLGVKRLDEIGVEDIQQVKAAMQQSGRTGRPRHPRTINQAVDQLLHILGCAKSWHRLASVPDKPKRLKVGKPRIEIYDEETQDRMKAAAQKRGTRDLVLLLLGLHAGLRASEMIGLCYTDIDLAGSSPHLWVNRQESEPGKTRPPKDGEARCIPLTQELLAALKAHRHLGDRVLLTDKGEHADLSALHSWMGSIERRAGVPLRHRLHIWRHCFASMLLAKGASPAAVQALLGHSTLQMTMRYIHELQAGDRVQAIGLLNQTSGEKTEEKL